MPLTVKTWLDAALAFFYPENCQLCFCERAKPQEGYICNRCWKGVRFICPPFCRRCGLPYEGEITTAFQCGNCQDMELSFSSARSAVFAAGIVREVIHRYKYNRALWFEPFLAELLARAAAPVLQGASPSWDAIAPVPLHPLKERAREFNQAARIAAHLARRTGIPLRTSLVRRTRPTLTQTHLNRVERAQNVAHAFEGSGDRSIQGQRIVLVDDVLTTGATTSACAEALRESGAAEVCVWTVARGI